MTTLEEYQELYKALPAIQEVIDNNKIIIEEMSKQNKLLKQLKKYK